MSTAFGAFNRVNKIRAKLKEKMHFSGTYMILKFSSGNFGKNEIPI